LLDRDRRAESVDGIDVRPLHLVEKLPRIRREGLHVAALAFRIDGVEGQRRLSRPAQSCDDSEGVARDLDVDIFQIVLARAMHTDAGQHYGAIFYFRRRLGGRPMSVRRGPAVSCTVTVTVGDLHENSRLKGRQSKWRATNATDTKSDRGRLQNHADYRPQTRRER
jgi:hypothetical protein